MGGSQSTRQIEIEPGNTIKITEDVHRRLLGLPDKKNEEPVGESQGTAQLSKDQVEALKHQIEDEYRQTVAEASVHIKAQEFARAVQEVEEKFLEHIARPVCQDLQQEVYKCYQDHLKEPLNCSSQVRAFTDAVEKARRDAIMTKQT